MLAQAQRITLLCGMLIGLLLVAGCAATVPTMPDSMDHEAKQFRPDPELANVYVARNNQFTGSAILFQVILDGRVQGGIAPGTYLLFEVPPGQHTVSVITNENEDSALIDAVAGQNYFVEVQPRWGMVSARVAVSNVDTAHGRLLVEAAKRAKPVAVRH